MTPSQLLKKYRVISDQVTSDELHVILRELDGVLRCGVAGDVVEFGCYVGTTSLFLQHMLQQYAGPRQLYVYDSFEGLPPKTEHDASPAGTHFVTGSLSATKAQFVRTFKKAGLPLPIIYKGWFAEVPLKALPETVAFAFLDGDYYESITASLRLLSGRLSDGSVIVIDDYQSEALPGVARAVDEWLRGHPSARVRVSSSLAIISGTGRRSAGRGDGVKPIRQRGTRRSSR